MQRPINHSHTKDLKLIGAVLMTTILIASCGSDDEAMPTFPSEPDSKKESKAITPSAFAELSAMRWHLEIDNEELVAESIAWCDQFEAKKDSKKLGCDATDITRIEYGNTTYYYSRQLGNSIERKQAIKNEYDGRRDEPGITLLEEPTFAYLKIAGATGPLYDLLEEQWQELQERISGSGLEAKVYYGKIDLARLRRALLENFYLETSRCRSTKIWRKMRKRGMYRGGYLALSPLHTFPIDTKRDQIGTFIEIDPKTNKFKGLSAMRLDDEDAKILGPRFIKYATRMATEDRVLMFHFLRESRALLDYKKPFVLETNTSLAKACDKFYGDRIKYKGTIFWGKFYPYYDEAREQAASREIDKLPMSRFEPKKTDGVALSFMPAYTDILQRFSEIPVYFPKIQYENDPYWHELKSEM